MALIETKVFESEKGALVQTGDTSLEIKLREHFETEVRVHGKCPVAGGGHKAGILVEDRSPSQVVSALNEIGVNVEEVHDEDGYKRVLWPE